MGRFERFLRWAARQLPRLVDWWLDRKKRQQDALREEKKELRDELEEQSPSERKRTARRFVRPDRDGG